MRYAPGGLLVVGVLLFLFSLSANVFGIGHYPGIGMRQTAGAIVGVVLAAGGMVWLRKAKGREGT